MILRSVFNDTEKQPTCNHAQRIGLSDYSPKDKPWNNHRANTDHIAGMYEGVPEFERIQSNMYDCSGWLAFNWVYTRDTGEAKLKLKKANFCRTRHCPVCQWRRSMMWQARFYQALPKITEDYPSSRFIFLTLTLRNCEISDLKQTCQHMNTAWRKFIKRKDLKPIQGWIRTTEVTYNRDDRSAHPHYHCLLMVPASWFSHNYVKQSRFVQLWSESLQDGYDAGAHVRVVRPKKGASETLSNADLLTGAAQETLKYATKADDLKADKRWFLEYNRQVKGLRFMASGGAFKDVLKADNESNEDLILSGDSTVGDDVDPELVRFNWHTQDRQYLKKADFYD